MGVFMLRNLNSMMILMMTFILQVSWDHWCLYSLYYFVSNCLTTFKSYRCPLEQKIKHFSCFYRFIRIVITVQYSIATTIGIFPTAFSSFWKLYNKKLMMLHMRSLDVDGDPLKASLSVHSLLPCLPLQALCFMKDISCSCAWGTGRFVRDLGHINLDTYCLFTYCQVIWVTVHSLGRIHLYCFGNNQLPCQNQNHFFTRHICMYKEFVLVKVETFRNNIMLSNVLYIVYFVNNIGFPPLSYHHPGTTVLNTLLCHMGYIILGINTQSRPLSVVPYMDQSTPNHH